jgi:hypothetical protein
LYFLQEAASLGVDAWEALSVEVAEAVLELEDAFEFEREQAPAPVLARNIAKNPTWTDRMAPA